MPNIRSRISGLEMLEQKSIDVNISATEMDDEYFKVATISPKKQAKGKVI